MPNTVALSDARPNGVSMGLGLAAKTRSQAAIALGAILGDTFRLLVKTQICNGTVVGLRLAPLHALTAAHYENLFAACDVLAERIRSLGHPAPLPQMTRSGDVGTLGAEHLVADLVNDHEALVRAMRTAAAETRHAGDPDSYGLIVQRLAFHEKAVSMLRAMHVR